MLKTLLMMHLKGLANRFFSRLHHGKKMSMLKKVMFALLAIYLFGCLFFSIGGLFYLFGESLIALHLDWMYFALAAFMGIFIGLIGSMFTASGVLFEAKDNELLLSMPIPPKMILLSRLLTLLILEYMYSLLMTIPIAIVYQMLSSLSFLQWLYLILGSLVYPFLCLAIVCLLGWIIAYISSKVRHKTLVQTVFMVAFFFGYLYFYMSIQDYVGVLLEQGQNIADTLSRVLPPIYYFGMSIAESDFIYFMKLCIICLVPFGIVYLVLKKNFEKIVMLQKGKSKVVYKKRSLKTSSLSGALIKRELKRFISMPAYMFNCGIGTLFYLVLGGGIFFKGEEIIQLIFTDPSMANHATAMLIMMFMMISFMNQMSAVSISLEGSGLWILKSSPISEKTIFTSKVIAHVFVSMIGFWIGAIMVILKVPMNVIEMLALFILPFLSSLWVALSGLVWNLLFPNLTWTNATLLIKQSGSVLGSTITGMVTLGMLPLVYLFSDLKVMISLHQFYLFYAVYLLLLCLGAYYYLKTKGIQKFKEI